ncbi:MAG: YdcF family protein, partial [Burkholderiaceae bacterium]
HWLSRWLLDPPAALSAERIGAIRAQAAKSRNTAIVVLGGGSEPLAPEYGTSNLNAASAERLRYGLWLARATGVPVAFSGGIGWGQLGSQTEAQVAERIARDDFGLTLRWAESQSRDTRQNAAFSLALLRRAGVNHVLLVTHDWHMPRALRDFRRAANPGVEETSGGRAVPQDGFTIEAAPMGLATRAQLPYMPWLPSGDGALHVRRVLREALGSLMGA